VEVLAAVAWKHILRGTQIDIKKDEKRAENKALLSSMGMPICLFL